METATTILRYWFGDAIDEAEVIRRQSDRWWKKDPRTDAELLSRFAAALAAESRDALTDWSETAHGQLARILLCDQFPRNMYRGTARAFAWDARARDLARSALDRGQDQALRAVERVFVYIPFEHSEDRIDQARSVALFTSLHAQAPAALKPAFWSFLDYAVRHRAIVDRFGRFPHRNAVLGRESTVEEGEFLKTPGSSF